MGLVKAHCTVLEQVPLRLDRGKQKPRHQDTYLCRIGTKGDVVSYRVADAGKPGVVYMGGK